MEFGLVGLLVSLAISNGHILEASLPMAIYKCGSRPCCLHHQSHDIAFYFSNMTSHRTRAAYGQSTYICLHV